MDVLISEPELRQRVAALAAQINTDYEDQNPILIGILKGCFIFMADLVRHLTVPQEIDFIAVSSYNASTQTTGVVRLLKDLNTNIFNRHVLIVEDIVDTGLTLQYIKQNLLTRKPASIRICALLDKTAARKIPITVDYTGFVIPNHFVVGYGLDFNEQYRHLPYIARLDSDS